MSACLNLDNVNLPLLRQQKQALVRAMTGKLGVINTTHFARCVVR